MNRIFINYDYTTEDEFSYGEGEKIIEKYPDYVFETNCLLFIDRKDCDVTIRKKNGEYINNQEIYKNTGEYTDKEIRKEHILLKIFLAGGFKWQKK